MSEKQVDLLGVEIVKLMAEAGERRLWRTYRALHKATEALAEDLDPKYGEAMRKLAREKP